MADRSKRFSRVMLGAFVVIGAALFVFALLQANAVREWLNPSKQLRLVLPDAGLFGLREGADIEILGTQAGRFRVCERKACHNTRKPRCACSVLSPR